MLFVTFFWGGGGWVGTVFSHMLFLAALYFYLNNLTNFSQFLIQQEVFIFYFPSFMFDDDSTKIMVHTISYTTLVHHV